MATATFMATFNKDVIETDVFSEANAVTYKFQLGGMTNYSGPGFVKRNTTDFTGTLVNGLNMRSFTGDAMVEIKSYELTPTTSTMNNSFKTYMDTVAHELVVIVSGKALRSSPDIDTWFTSKGSVAWPGSHMCNNFSCGYVALYSPSLNKIVAEVAKYSDGNDKGLAEYLTVFDVLSDIGVLGFPGRIVYDPAEYTTLNGYEFKRFPTSAVITKMSDVGMVAGRTYMIQSTLQASEEMVAANMKTRVNLRWFKGNTLLDASTVLESQSTMDTNVLGYSKAPDGADGVTIVVSRFPKNDAVTGRALCKNFTFVEVSRDGSEFSSTAAIGVNGIKASLFNEGQAAPHIMSLGLDVLGIQNIVPIVGMREGDSGSPPSP
ncbi:long tail fiber protein proximal connector [Acinetobacter phage Acj9]|uniref:Gp35 hinge connector of long tail fiber proximal connector n=1 Tax=Acinetobacter phage Acj9 TaxID=760939 RepID=E5EQ26_9CAUD|nr:long tail fiber protein proximal connector [Acinetobacter phage Acj9]ADG60142.1 gp35 hinge connector of long tail fiber proximal connector [Acinetobacter phage Acj9]